MIHSLPRITIFWSLVTWFANDFHSWLRHSWKSLANHLTRDQKSSFTHALFCISSNEIHMTGITGERDISSNNGQQGPLMTRARVLSHKYYTNDRPRETIMAPHRLTQSLWGGIIKHDLYIRTTLPRILTQKLHSRGLCDIPSAICVCSWFSITRC